MICISFVLKKRINFAPKFKE